MSGTILLTVEETAAQLRIARRRIFEMIRDGSLPSVKIGRSRRIRSTDLAAYVAKLQDGDRSAREPTKMTTVSERMAQTGSMW